MESLTAAFADSKRNPCLKSLNEFQCIQQNLGEFYKADYKAFWTIFRKFKNKAKKCNDIKLTAKFLEFAYLPTGGGEITEGVAEVLESLIIINPKCFVESAILLQDKMLVKLFDLYINHPLYHQPLEIKSKLDPFLHNSRYKTLMKHYKL